MSFLWVVFTVVAAAGQTARNAMQRELTASLGAVGATHVRFLFGFPFALIFLASVLAFEHAGLPATNPLFWLWVLIGAATQIGGTALMLMTMEARSFVVTVAYLKIEPLFVAVLGLIFLHDPLTVPMIAAIVIAVAGVTLISLRPSLLAASRGAARQPTALGRVAQSWRPAAQGLASGALFGLSSIGYRGAILALHLPGYLLPATFTLAVGLVVQAAILSGWLAWRAPGTLRAIARLWRPSLFAGFMGSAASEFWFLAFALATAASVRTLGLIDVLFAQAVSHIVFRQKTTAREAGGIALLVAGAVLLVYAHG